MWSVLTWSRSRIPRSGNNPKGRETLDAIPDRLEFLLSREGVGRNEKKSHTPYGEAKTAEVEVRSSRLGSQQAAVLNSLRSTKSKRGYCHAIDEFIEWYCSEPRLSFSKVVTRYRIHFE